MYRYDALGSKIKAKFKCPQEYKSRFKDSKCLLTISVGQKVHEGKEFEETIRLVSSAFKKCTILVDDSLQRHTMQILDKDDAELVYKKSVIEGDLWIERNKEIYGLLKIPYEIMRWDYWLYHEFFQREKERVESLYEKNREYQNAFKETIEIFLKRFQKRINIDKFEYNRAYSLSLEYLKEECAAMCLWATKEYDFEVYPSKRNMAMAKTHEILIRKNFPNCLNSVSIKFEYKNTNHDSENLEKLTY